MIKMCKMGKKMTSSSLLRYVLFIIFVLFMSSYTITNAYAQEQTAGNQEGWRFLSMALSTGLAALSAGYAVARTGEAAIAAITEKPELFGRTILYVGLAEGIAIYGILISFLIWIT